MSTEHIRRNSSLFCCRRLTIFKAVFIPGRWQKWTDVCPVCRTDNNESGNNGVKRIPFTRLSLLVQFCRLPTVCFAFASCPLCGLYTSTYRLGSQVNPSVKDCARLFLVFGYSPWYSVVLEPQAGRCLIGGSAEAPEVICCLSCSIKSFLPPPLYTPHTHTSLGNW